MEVPRASESALREEEESLLMKLLKKSYSNGCIKDELMVFACPEKLLEAKHAAYMKKNARKRKFRPRSPQALDGFRSL